MALVGALIVSMANAEGGVIDDSVILIERDRIKAIGKRGGGQCARRNPDLDVKGKTIIPGLVISHAHGPMASTN
ncbi:MAG: hypothetical protein IPP45_16175 [Sphingomonadales bacterium]|nr:hypothetical protein [Sphingomonadales bacterium]